MYGVLPISNCVILIVVSVRKAKGFGRCEIILYGMYISSSLLLLPNYRNVLQFMAAHCDAALRMSSWSEGEFYPIQAWFRRRTFHVPNLMQMSSNKELRSLTLGSAHEKFDV